MSFKLMLGISLCTNVVAGAVIFMTPHSGVGAVIVLVTMCELFYLLLTGKKQNSTKMFWSGLVGLVWLAFALGFAWDVKAPPQLANVRTSSSFVARTYGLFIDTVYNPITRTVKAKGPTMGINPRSGAVTPMKSIVEFRSILEADYTNYRERSIPSLANFSRFLAALSAWLVAVAPQCLFQIKLRQDHRRLYPNTIRWSLRCRGLVEQPPKAAITQAIVGLADALTTNTKSGGTTDEKSAKKSWLSLFGAKKPAPAKAKTKD